MWQASEGTAYKILIRFEAKRPLGRIMSRWAHDNKFNHKELVLEDVH
jgi:hypothetical protein